MAGEGTTECRACAQEGAFSSALGRQGRLRGEGYNLAEPSRRVFHVGKRKEVFEGGERVFVKAQENDNVWCVQGSSNGECHVEAKLVRAE